MILKIKYEIFEKVDGKNKGIIGELPRYTYQVLARSSRERLHFHGRVSAATGTDNIAKTRKECARLENS